MYKITDFKFGDRFVTKQGDELMYTGHIGNMLFFDMKDGDCLYLSLYYFNADIKNQDIKPL